MGEAPVQTSASADHIDGRSARRLRNRQAVIDAYLELVMAGNLAPSIEEVAAHSGVSFRSIYRYFSTVDALVTEVAEHSLELVTPLLTIADVGIGTLDDRVERFVVTMLDLHVTCAPLTESARNRPAIGGTADSTFATIRSIIGRQISRHFAAELAHLDHERRKAKVGALFVAFTYDSLRMLNEMYPDNPDQVRAILSNHLHLHLAAR